MECEGYGSPFYFKKKIISLLPNSTPEKECSMPYPISHLICQVFENVLLSPRIYSRQVCHLDWEKRIGTHFGMIPKLHASTSPWPRFWNDVVVRDYWCRNRWRLAFSCGVSMVARRQKESLLNILKEIAKIIQSEDRKAQGSFYINACLIDGEGYLMRSKFRKLNALWEFFFFFLG